jgi:uncharacterized protein YukE
MDELAHIEIEALDSYISQLYKMHDILKDNFDDAKKELDQIAESWKDVKFVKFKESFDEVYPEIKGIAEWVEKTAIVMDKKWSPIIEKYLEDDL